MIKIRLGGFPFNVPQKWEEVPFDRALELYKMEGFDISHIVTTLIEAPDKTHLKYTSGVILSVFEILSFVTETPELVEDKIKLPNVRTWKYKQYELCRQALVKHQKNLPLCFARITEILEQPKESFVEVGAKAVDQMLEYIESWGDYMETKDPTDKEQAAGVERLQAFGAYAIIANYAEKYGISPDVAENKDAHAVIADYLYTNEKSKFIEAYQENERLAL